MGCILGISAYYHDSAAALLRDGEIAYAIEKERVTREKHATGFYQEVIEYCLQAEGISLAVASNKFQEGAERLIEDFFPDIDFVAVLGNSPRFPLKPDAEVVRYITGLAGVGASETVFVGDSATDIKTAINGGVRSIGVTWGFRPESDLVAAGADEIVHKPDQIREVL